MDENMNKEQVDGPLPSSNDAGLPKWNDDARNSGRYDAASYIYSGKKVNFINKNLGIWPRFLFILPLTNKDITVKLNF